jgi:hypothetical protein
VIRGAAQNRDRSSRKQTVQAIREPPKPCSPRSTFPSQPPPPHQSTSQPRCTAA